MSFPLEYKEDIERALSAAKGTNIDLDRYEHIFYELKKNGKVLVLGPVGSGKTTVVEALYLNEALKAVEGKEVEFFPKVNYALPTTSLINAKQNEFEKELKPAVESLTGIEINITTAHSFVPKHFFSDITLYSYDMYSALMFLAFEKNYRVLQLVPGSAIHVLDEVHLFRDKKALEVLTSLAGSLSNVIILTGTINTALRNMYKEKGVKILELEPFRTNKIRDFAIERAASEQEKYGLIYNHVVDTLTNGNGKVLVVVNTVRDAMETYMRLSKTLNGKRVVMVHSAMSLGERERVEKNLNENDVIVATQVAEVGLNIKNLWKVITVQAPLDSLIQRFGRIRVEGEAVLIDEVYKDKKAKDGVSQYSVPYYHEHVRRTMGVLESYVGSRINEIIDDVWKVGCLLDEVYSDERLPKTALIRPMLAQNTSAAAKNNAEVARLRESWYTYVLDEKFFSLGLGKPSLEVLKDYLYRVSYKIVKGRVVPESYLMSALKKSLGGAGKVTVVHLPTLLDPKNGGAAFSEVNFYWFLKNGLRASEYAIVADVESLLTAKGSVEEGTSHVGVKGVR